MANILENGPIRKMLRERSSKRAPENELRGYSVQVTLYENSSQKDYYVSLPLPREKAEQLFREIQTKLAYAST